MNTFIKRPPFIAIFFGLVVALVGINLSSPTASAATCNDGVPVGSLHRFYNLQNGGHFYVVGETHEYETVKSNPNFRDESPMWYTVCADSSTLPVYRFYNLQKGTHFYTMNEAEAAHIRNNLSGAFRYEGAVFYAYKNRVPLRGFYVSPTVHRFYNFKNGTHFYTSNQAEATYINDNLYNTLRYEGEVFYLDVGHQP